MSEKKQAKWDHEFTHIAKRAMEGVDLLRSESDRGCILVGGSMVDEALAALLKAFLIREAKVVKELLESPNGPLATFAARGLLCRALGIIGERAYGDIERIRTIRNRAAHFDRRGGRGFRLSFSDPEIADQCRSLSMIPSEMRMVLATRDLFTAAVTIFTASYTEYAVGARFTEDNMDRATTLHMMTDLIPRDDFSAAMRIYLQGLHGHAS